MNVQETKYMQGDREPVTSSVLISNSKYLNSPLYRDAFAQACLRRIGHDVPFTYHIPWMNRAIKDVTDNAEVLRLLEVEKTNNPKFAAWLAERTLTQYSAKDLQRHENGTLGEAIRIFLVKTGFDLEFMYKDAQPVDDLTYMLKRIADGHDIQHLVTGFGPNTAGEEALALANVGGNARYFSPAFAAFLNASTIFVSTAGYSRVALHYHNVLPTFLEAMRQGITAGLSIKAPLMLVRWEDYLDWPLDDIAAELGIIRGPAEDWTWTSEAASG